MMVPSDPDGVTRALVAQDPHGSLRSPWGLVKVSEALRGRESSVRFVRNFLRPFELWRRGVRSNTRATGVCGRLQAGYDGGVLSASGRAASSSGQDLFARFLYNKSMERRKMAVAAPEWELEVERGPDWLFVRMKPPRGGLIEAPDLVTPLWGLIEQHFTYRIVLEMGDVDWLPSQLIGQLVVLVKRVHEHGGVLRLCGMSELCEQSIRLCRLSNCLPNYRNRAEAVLGPRPLQPR